MKTRQVKLDRCGSEAENCTGQRQLTMDMAGLSRDLVEVGIVIAMRCVGYDGLAPGRKQLDEGLVSKVELKELS